MTPASPVPAADSAATDFAAVERAQRLERAKFLAGLTIPQLKGELDGLRAAGEEQDPREAQFLRTLISARAATAVKQAEQIGSPMQLRQWAAAQIEDGQFDEQFFEDVISPVYAKKLQETPDFGMADVVAIGKALPDVATDLWSGIKGLAKNLPQALVESQIPYASFPRPAQEALGAAAEQGTLETIDLLRSTVRRAVAAFRRNALMAVNGDTPEKWEATRQKRLESLAKEKPDWTPEQLAQHPSIPPTWEEFNQGKLPLEEGRKQALTDVRTARAMVRAERGQRSVSAFDVASLLLGNNEKEWNQNRENIIKDMRARGMSDEAVNKLVPPTWEEYAAAEKAKRPQLSEEQIKAIPGMGEFLSLENFVPMGVGFNFAKKMSKPTVAAMTLGEKVAPTVVQRAGKVVEGAGKVLGSSTGRAAVAVTAATAAGLEPTQAILAGVLANAPGGRQLSKAAPEIVKKAGQILQRPLPGPVGAMMNVAKATGKGAAAGAATMLPMAYFAGQTPEERGMLLAGGMVPGGVGGFSSGVLQFGQSYWAPQSKYSAERVASTSYGTPLDAAHNKATAGLDNAQFNSVEAVRDVVRRASGGSGQLYVLTPEDYAAKLTEMGRADARASSGVVFDGQTAFVRLGAESLLHEPAHIFEHFLLPEERGQILDAITDAYTPEQMLEMKAGYEKALGQPITLDQFISEVIAENFQAALNAGPLRKLGTPSKVAREVYATLGRLGERMGFRDLSPGGPVQTSETLRFTPSFLVQQALLNVLEAQKLDGLKPANTPQQAVQQASQVPTQPSAPAPVAPAPAAPTPVAPRTVDVGVLNPVPEELLTEPTVAVPGAISGIPQTPKPASPAPATPAPAPAPAATPNVRGVTEQARAPFKGPSPETLKHNSDVLAAELKKPQADRVPLQTDYFAAVDQDNNPKKLTQPQREFQRRLAEAADRLGYKNPLRRLYDKVFVALNGRPDAKGFIAGTFGFSMDKLIQNLDILRGWAEENGKPDIVAMVEDPQLAADVQTYLANQANGYGGGGERLKRPAITDPARFPVENKNYTPIPLAPERRQFINFLMGLEGVADKTPLSPAAAFVVELAQLNGLTEATVVPETGNRVAKIEFNPVTQKFREAGFDPILLNQVVENLRTDRMGTPLRRREDLNFRAGVQGSIQAGFMPADKAPKRDVEYLGVVTSDGVRMVSVPRGSEKFHDEVGLSRGDRFRYDPKSGNVVWTDLREEVDKRTRDFLSAWLDMRGYKVGRQADWSGRAYGQWMPAAPRKGAKEWVDTAAIRTEDGQIFTGTSHFAAVQAAVSAGVDFDRTQATDGFLTNAGNFVDREEGYRIANAAGQLDQRAQDSSVRFGSEAAPVLESAALEGAGNRIAEKRSRPVTRGQLMPAGDGNVRRLNIGLKIGRTDTLLTTDEVLAVLKDMGFEPGRTQVRQSGTEPTLIVDIPADNVTPETMNQLSTALQQEAIAVYNPKEDTGALYGPKAADWGPFNKDYFLDFEDAAARPALTNVVDIWRAMRRAREPKKDETVSISEDFETLPDGATVLLARAGDQIVGYVGVDKNFSGDGLRQLQTKNRWGWLDIEVSEKWRRRGIGYDLYARAQDLAKAAGVKYTMSSKTPDGRKFFPEAKARYEDLQDSPNIRYMPAPPVNSEAFKKWFGDSKVVDARGRARRVYHGTSADFTVFDPNSSAAREGGREGLLYFTDNRALARDFSSTWDGEAGNLMQVFLKMERPLLVDAKGADWGAVVYDGTEMSLDDLAREARRSGYDGLIAENVTDSLHGPDRLNTTYVAFEPTQVKSATDNVGTFDAGNPDIRYMPAKLEGKRLEHAVPEKTLKLTHFSNVAGLNVIDPSFMSQDTTKKLLRGDPRSFWMVGESELKGADGAKGKSQKYTAEVSGSKLYDMRADPLNLWEKPQPQIDKTLKADGYAGFVMETNDGRTFAAVYEAIPLNPKGEKEAKARAAAEAKKQAALANVKVSRKIQAEQKATLKRDRTWEDVLAEADRTGKPLYEVAEKFGVDFMPAGPEVSKPESLEDGAPVGMFMPSAFERMLREHAITPEILAAIEGKTGFAFTSDWADAGRPYVTTNGREIDVLRGGVGYSYLPEYFKKAAWATTANRATLTHVTRKINNTDGIGLVVMGAAESSASSRAFSYAFLAELEDAIANKEVSPKRVDALIRDAFKAVGRPDIRSLSEFRQVLPLEAAVDPQGLTFSEREAVVKAVGGIRNVREFGVPSWNDVLRRYNVQRGDYSPGQIVSILQFKQGEAPRRADAAGVPAHPSYETVLLGEGLGLLTDKVMISDFFADLFREKGTAPGYFTRVVQTKLPTFKLGQGSASLRSARVSPPTK